VIGESEEDYVYMARLFQNLTRPANLMTQQIGQYRALSEWHKRPF
jgi:hypothetical protein